MDGLTDRQMDRQSKNHRTLQQSQWSNKASKNKQLFTNTIELVSWWIQIPLVCCSVINQVVNIKLILEMQVKIMPQQDQFD